MKNQHSQTNLTAASVEAHPVANPAVLGVGLLLTVFALGLSGKAQAATATTAQLQAETNARIAADTAEKSARTNADSAETKARIAADNKETAARTAADKAETTARTDAVNTLTAGLATEKNDREQSDIALGTAYKQDLQAAIFQLQAQINNAVPPLPPGQFQVSLTRCGNSNTPQWGPCLYDVGDTGPAGGIVFYVTKGGLHGLEAAPVQQANTSWGCLGTSIDGATGAAVGTGAANTAAIVAACTDPGIAAKVADTYSLNGYDDWYLPSKDELNELYKAIALNGVGGIAIDYYWSSTGLGANVAWFQGFGNGLQHNTFKNDTLRVQAVRAF